MQNEEMKDSGQVPIDDVAPFLRSINICFDAAHAERISHFRPTQKSVSVLHAFSPEQSERSYLITAPYGSGKSLLLTYLLHAIENRESSWPVLQMIGDRIQQIDPHLGTVLSNRRECRKKGLVIPLHGFQANLASGIQEAIQNTNSRNKLGRQFRALKSVKVNSIDDAIQFLDLFKKICLRIGIDTIAILWDETGRHLETLLTDGRASELSDIQLIAEYASRSTDIPMYFGLTLHQGLLHYTQKMPQSVRAEWMKISGRFATLQFIDDSKETHRMIADLIEAQRGTPYLPSIKDRQIAEVAIKEHGLFRDHSVEELTKIAAQISPIHISVLYLLPRIASRVAQHERTLFTYLTSIQAQDTVTVAHLYDYFSSAMRADTSVGGTYKQWLETESAISKVAEDTPLANALKTACLLSLGTKGERNRLPRTTLEWALEPSLQGNRPEDVVDSLIERKLLLFREHSHDVSVWHGTDLDLRGRLLDMISRNQATFDLVGFLDVEAPPEAWKSLEFNTRTGTHRYWSGEYITTTELLARNCSGSKPRQETSKPDGWIHYYLGESNEDLEVVRKAARNPANGSRVVSVVPSAPLDIRSSALEVWCLSQMLNDPELTGEDPLVLPELKQMVDDARLYMQSILDRLIVPATKDGPIWYYEGEGLRVNSGSDLRRELSRIAYEVFPDTPVILNELVNRHKVSGTIVNSRKKLIMGILERHGTCDLGLKITSPEASMFRTILVHTGLYREVGTDLWAYANVSDTTKGSNSGLWKVWNLLSEFFTVPDAEQRPKQVSSIFDILSKPPFGVRQGLFPILFAAGIKAFAHAIALRRKGLYINDILPSVIEDLAQQPEDYELSVIELNAEVTAYFECLRGVFTGNQQLSIETDIVRAAYDAIESWLFQLPRATWSTSVLSPQAKKFLKLVRAIRNNDPIEQLMAVLPAQLGYVFSDVDQVSDVILPLKEEIEGVSHTYAKKAYRTLQQAFSQPMTAQAPHIQKLAQNWAAHFADSLMTEGMPSIARSFLSRIRINYKDAGAFLDSIALLIVGKPVNDWDDTTAIDFESRVQELSYRIEAVSIQSASDKPGSHDKEALEGLANLLIERIDVQVSQLSELIGPEETRRVVIAKLGDDNGHPK